MDIQQQFEQAAARSKELTKRPSNEELLLLYALYKQATECKTKEAAMQEYVALVNRLHEQYA
jgi:diazepam-binding inhibitor (GABA receptor modulator, acyl-CoA-binding protein)